MDKLYQEALDRLAGLCRETINLGVENPSTMPLAKTDLPGRPSMHAANLEHFAHHYHAIVSWPPVGMT